MNMAARRRDAYRTKRPEWMPVTCRVSRVAKGKYLCELHFLESRREFTTEIIVCRTKRIAQQRVKMIHPNIVRFRK